VLLILLAFQVKIGQLYSEHTVDEVLERMFTWRLVDISRGDLHIVGWELLD